jgi:hypothetical protein
MSDSVHKFGHGFGLGRGYSCLQQQSRRVFVHSLVGGGYIRCARETRAPQWLPVAVPVQRWVETKTSNLKPGWGGNSKLTTQNSQRNWVAGRIEHQHELEHEYEHENRASSIEDRVGGQAGPATGGLGGNSKFIWGWVGGRIQHPASENRARRRRRARRRALSDVTPFARPSCPLRAPASS